MIVKLLLLAYFVFAVFKRGIASRICDSMISNIDWLPRFQCTCLSFPALASLQTHSDSNSHLSFPAYKRGGTQHINTNKIHFSTDASLEFDGTEELGDNRRRREDATASADIL